MDQAVIAQAFAVELIEVHYMMGVLKGKNLLIKRLFKWFVIELSVEFISSCVGWECYPGFKWYFVYSG
jgi:hypothetical protein